jgi:hypothetical protein
MTEAPTGGKRHPRPEGPAAPGSAADRERPLDVGRGAPAAIENGQVRHRCWAYVPAQLHDSWEKAGADLDIWIRTGPEPGDPASYGAGG